MTAPDTSIPLDVLRAKFPRNGQRAQEFEAAFLGLIQKGIIRIGKSADGVVHVYFTPAGALLVDVLLFGDTE